MIFTVKITSIGIKFSEIGYFAFLSTFYPGNKRGALL